MDVQQLDSEKYYNSSAEVDKYDRWTSTDPYWIYIDSFMFKTLLGDVTNKSVLDLGCGNGLTEKMLVDWGARKVVGIDIAAEMIEKAKQMHIPNAEFMVKDPSDSRELVLGEFDFVTTKYVMEYMEDETQLRNYMKYAYDNLRPGGLFCGVTATYDREMPLSGYKPIVKVKYARSSPDEFASVNVLLRYTKGDDEATAIKVTIHALYSNTLEKLLKEVGFSEVTRHTMLVSEEGKAYFTQEEVCQQMAHYYPFTARK